MLEREQMRARGGPVESVSIGKIDDLLVKEKYGDLTRRAEDRMHSHIQR